MSAHIVPGSQNHCINIDQDLQFVNIRGIKIEKGEIKQTLKMKRDRIFMYKTNHKNPFEMSELIKNFTMWQDTRAL